jgi:hypothetical protein
MNHIKQSSRKDKVKNISMPNVRAKNRNSQGRRKRAIIAALLLPVFVVAASILFGVRAALFGAEPAEIEKLMFMWGIAVFLLGILLGILFIFESPAAPGYWKVVFLSAVLGIFLCMFLYPRLPENVLVYIAKPVENPLLNNPTRLLLIGGIDGFMFGVIVGLFAVVLDPKITILNRFGFVRYFMLSILITGILVGSMAINELGGFWDLAANFIPLILLLLLKLGVILWDKRHSKIV